MDTVTITLTAENALVLHQILAPVARGYEIGLMGGVGLSDNADLAEDIRNALMTALTEIQQG